MNTAQTELGVREPQSCAQLRGAESPSRAPAPPRSFADVEGDAARIFVWSRGAGGGETVTNDEDKRGGKEGKKEEEYVVSLGFFFFFFFP